MYLKFSTKNYIIAGKGGHWPAFKDISLLYLTSPTCCFIRIVLQQTVQVRQSLS